MNSKRFERKISNLEEENKELKSKLEEMQAKLDVLTSSRNTNGQESNTFEIDPDEDEYIEYLACVIRPTWDEPRDTYYNPREYHNDYKEYVKYAFRNVYKALPYLDPSSNRNYYKPRFIKSSFEEIVSKTPIDVVDYYGGINKFIKKVFDTFKEEYNCDLYEESRDYFQRHLAYCNAVYEGHCTSHYYEENTSRRDYEDDYEDDYDL